MRKGSEWQMYRYTEAVVTVQYWHVVFSLDYRTL